MLRRLPTYECRPCTPPSIWADMVRFSNLSSPEYIMDLGGGQVNKSETPPPPQKKKYMKKKKREEEKGNPPKTFYCPLKLQHSPQDRQALGPNILAAMLDPGYEVGHELLNGAFILDGA